MSKLSDKEMRDLEVDIANAAVRGVLITWGTGWFYLSNEQRESELALTIMQYASGHSSPHIAELDRWGDLRKYGITAWDCMTILHICKDRSVVGDYGYHLVKYADATPGWDMDPIPYLKKYVRQIFGG